MNTGSKSSRVWIPRLIAAAGFGLCLVLPQPGGLDPARWEAIRRSLAIFTLCIVLWVTGALPLMVTSLLPLALFPLLRVLSVKESYSLFGNEVVFFLLGVFVLASGVIRTGLSTRIAWSVLRIWGRSPRMLLGATILLPAFGSFWMSEHAVAAMMFPVVLEVANVLRVHTTCRSYGQALFLALAWGCVVGGVATFLGGGRAPLAVGILREKTGDDIEFLRWMIATLPTVVLMLGVAYGMLLWISRRESPDMEPVRELLAAKRRISSPMSPKERGMALLMLATVAGWTFFKDSLGGLAGVALLSAVLAFATGILDWKEVEQDVNWGILLMYGGAVTLGYAMQSSGAAEWLSTRLFSQFQGSPHLFVALMSFLSIALTEGMSNAAVVALLLPVSLNYAGGDVLLGRLVTMAIAVPAGLAFCLPMATPAVALAYASGLLTMKDTIVTGLILAGIAWVIFNVSAWLWFPVVGMGRVF